jgi:hypothetical protein
MEFLRTTGWSERELAICACYAAVHIDSRHQANLELACPSPKSRMGLK